MASRYYVKKFTTTTALASYLNFTETSPIEEGTGYVAANVLTAVTQTNFADWQDVNSADIAGVILISGGTNAQQYASISSVPSATTAGATITNIGTAGTPVNYRIYASDPKFSGTITELRVGGNGEIVMIWTDSGKLHF